MSTSTFSSIPSLIPLASHSSGLIDPETASLTFSAKDLFFTTTSLLAVAQGIPLEGSELIDDVVDSIDQVSGMLTFGGGDIIVDLTTPQGSIEGTVSGVALLTDFAQFAAGANGALQLSEGVITYDFAIGDNTVVDTFNLAEFASDWVDSFLFDLETTATFENGIVALELPTPFGDITGDLGFAGGQLSFDLDTPFGDLNSAVDFGEDAQVSLDDAVVLDLNSGQILVELLGLEFALPLESLAGTLTVDDGAATVSIPTVFGDLGGSFEFGPIASELAADFLTDISGEAIVEDGVLTGSLITPLGSLDGKLDVPQLANQAAEFLAQVNGTVTLGEGTAISNLETPFGLITESFDLGQFANYLDAPISQLI